MQINRYLKPEYIQLGMRNGHIDELNPEKDLLKEKQRLKEEALVELSDLFSKTGVIRNVSKFQHDLICRERKASTAIGNGIAIPHVRSMQPKQIAMIFARTVDGIEFLSPDDKPVHIIFGLTAPSYDERSSQEFLRFYQWLARSFKQEEWLSDALLSANDEHEIIAILSGLE